MRTPFNRSRGFTLVELAVTVAVMAIIATLAAPSFNQMIQRNRLTAGANELVAMLQLAKMEAIRSNGLVEVCATADGVSCAGADWRRAIVISRKNGENRVVRDLRLNPSFTAVGDAATIAAGNKIGFGADGMARVGAGVRSGGVQLTMSGLTTCPSLLVNVNVSRVQVSKVGCI